MSSVSTIGVGTTVRGSIRGEGDLEIHGRVEGAVVVTGEVIISETALLKSDVRARRITVRGAVAGDVSADESIVLEPGARVLGDLGAPQIGIRPGGLVRGNVSTGGPLPEVKAAPPPAAAAGRGRVAPAPAARPAPARAATPALAARPAPAARAAAAPAARPAAVAVAARPAPASRPRIEPAASSSRGDTAASASRGDTAASASRGDTVASAAAAARSPEAASVAEEAEELEADETEEADEAELTADGPPPPVVPALRKGAKASLRRKGAR
jgi:cytoskeletal protein CcmA (bactofilin family)